MTSTTTHQAPSKRARNEANNTPSALTIGVRGCVAVALVVRRGLAHELLRQSQPLGAHSTLRNRIQHLTDCNKPPTLPSDVTTTATTTATTTTITTTATTTTTHDHPGTDAPVL